MSHEDFRYRFIFEITEEQKNRVDALLQTYGLRRAIFSLILDDVLDLIEERGGLAIGLLFSGKVKPRDIIPTIAKAKEGTNE